MNTLPDWLRRVPRAFYLAALAWISWNIAYPYMQLSAAGYSPLLSGEGWIARFVMFEHVARAALDAIFLVGTGVTTEVLIHIHDALSKGAAE